MAIAPSTDLFRFRDFELDVAAYQLRCSGKSVRLERRPMDLLVLLVSHHGRLVTREEIVERLWPGKVVIDFDTGLNTLVSKVRHALHDSPDAPLCIETVPGKGYRFIAPVEVVAADGSGFTAGSRTSGVPAEAPPYRESSRRGGQWLVVSALLLTAGVGAVLWYARDREVAPPTAASQPPAQAAVTSIAVLPFADLSAERDQQYFSDGLTEEILNILAQSHGLRVIARTSSFSFKDQNVDIATIARKLNVTHVLEGSVRKSDDRVRITAQLVDAATSSHLWSQTYDRELTDIFAVQSDIAASVANALQVTLGDVHAATAAGNSQAYETFLRAHFFHQRRAPGDLDRAREYYQQALEIEPRLARAWAGLAGVYWVQTVTSVLPLAPGREKVRDAAERALALDPTLAEAHLRLANYEWSLDNFSAADVHESKAFALEPNNPLVLSFAASQAAAAGRFDEAIELQERAIAADPVSVLMRDNLATWYFLAGRLDEAKAEWLKMLELDPTRTLRGLGFVLVLDGQFDEALERVEPWPEGEDRTQCLALIYHGLGRRADADAALDKLIKLSEASDPFRVAEVYAYRGEIEKAFQWLQTATVHNRSQRYAQRPLWAMRHSPLLKPLHDDARWDAWVRSTQTFTRG